MKTALREIATARSGDKGNIANVGLWLREQRHWDPVSTQITAGRVAQADPALFRGPVRRYELPQLLGMNFVIENALEGGVNASLNLDAHGKSFSFLILALEVDLG